MFKITIERIDADVEIEMKYVYLTKEQAKLVSATGVRVEERTSNGFSESALDELPMCARIPIAHFRRQIERKIYEQVVEHIDIYSIINAVNERIPIPGKP